MFPGSSLDEMVAAGRELTLAWTQRVLNRGCAPGPCRVLDVGCGSGEFLRLVASEWPGVVAVGIDPHGVEGLRDGIRFEVRSAEQVGGLLERFDVVVSSMSVHHFGDPGAFFRSARRAVRWQSGRLVVVDWKSGVRTGIPESYFRFQEVRAMLEGAGWRVLESWEGPWHFAVEAMPTRCRMAVADDGQGRVPRGMLGTAPFFSIYDWDRGRPRFVERRPNPYQSTRQHLKTLDVARILDDAALYVAAGIGRRGQERLASRGFRMLLTRRSVAVSQVLEVAGRCLVSTGPHAGWFAGPACLPGGWTVA